MSKRPTAPAQLPPAGITGLNPAWSRLVAAPDAAGVERTWHLLDSWADRSPSERPLLTLLCVHGNPSWSFLWRNVLAQASDDDVRVIAVDQLDMGFSERTGQKRTLATRIDDLTNLTQTLGLTGLVVTVAHDWGGPISLGWALRHVDTNPITGPRLAGVVLTNTAVHQPAGSPAPSVIRLIRSRPMLRQTTVNSLTFIRGAYEMSRPRLPADVRDGFTAPYLDRSRREAIADFVADIPLNPSHESAATLDGIADGLSALSEVPTLLLWGPRDQVFGDLYLHDLEARLPHAKVHRFVNASHFVAEDADVAGAIAAWIPTLNPSADATTGGSDPRIGRAVTRGLADFSGMGREVAAVVEMAPTQRSISFGELSDRVEQLAAGMASFGIAAGDRVAVMVPPGIDLSLAVYACWRRGATLVLVDSGLGPKGMQRALVSADPDYLIGIDKALIAAKAMRWPGKRIAVGARPNARRRALGIATDLDALTALGGPADSPRPPFPDPDTVAAIAFTSGATGPSKGVVYRHHQIQAQRDALMALYELTPDDRLVAAFAPFALYGPTMHLTSVVPDMDVTAPGTLTATALAEAAAAIDATLVFASPAALVNTVATANDLPADHRAGFEAVRLLLSAGAPVRPELLRSARSLFPNAAAHTPYGMTEALPVADISLAELDDVADRDAEAAHDGDGVCVGFPLPQVDVTIDPLDEVGEPMGEPTTEPGVLGEIVVQAPHAREGYDRLWYTQHLASQPTGWHRTGDIGRLDASGRLWVGGRLGHVITTPSGPIAPVRHEQQLEDLPDVDAAAVVGVGPTGTQVVVAVVDTGGRHPVGAAPLELLDEARARLTAVNNTAVDNTAVDNTAVNKTAVDLAALLVVDRLPVDRRHNSKVDRRAVAEWAAKTLAGERVSKL